MRGRDEAKCRVFVQIPNANVMNIAAQWFRKANNRDVSTGPLARPFARTAHSFAGSALLALLARSLAPLTHSLARGKVNDSVVLKDYLGVRSKARTAK